MGYLWVLDCGAQLTNATTVTILGSISNTTTAYATVVEYN